MRPSDGKSPDYSGYDAKSALFHQEQATPVPSSIDWRQAFPEIVGRSAPMLRVLELVSKIAKSDSSVLVLGESGTGKELIASSIHRLSARSHKPFIPLNCSAIPETLLESELFGHEKGAFTGADRRRVGQFEAAEGGTIFLDEIGDMPASLQAKLLRVLQDRKFTPLGGKVAREADIRIIAATNKNLEMAVQRGTFRLDLYYRLNVLPVHLPPLRERHEDIPALLDFFVEASNRAHPNQSEPCFLTQAVVDRLCRYDWPGNVRQLQNLVERLIVMRGGGAVDVQDLPDDIRNITGNEPLAPSQGALEQPSGSSQQMSTPTGSANYPAKFGELPSAGLNLTTFIEDLENDLILQALERTKNNKNQAAKLLGMNRTTLVERIKKRKIQPLNAPSKEL